MYQLVFVAIGAVATGISALRGVSMMRDVKLTVARWLREHGLSNSYLMDAVVLLDKVGSDIQVSVRITAKTQPAQTIRTERTYSISKVTNPAVRAELEKHGHAEQNVLQLFNTA
jgi:hypothetical protein